MPNPPSQEELRHSKTDLKTSFWFCHPGLTRACSELDSGIIKILGSIPMIYDSRQARMTSVKMISSFSFYIVKKPSKAYYYPMLTKIDFDQIKKIIREVVREEIEFESKNIREDLNGEIKLARIELSNRITEVEKKVSTVQKDVSLFQLDIKKEFKKIQKDLSTIKKGVKETVSYFDNEDNILRNGFRYKKKSRVIITPLQYVVSEHVASEFEIEKALTIEMKRFKTLV